MRIKNKPARNFSNLEDQIFNKWTILRKAPNGRNGCTQYWCRCECGKEQINKAVNVVSGKTRSCGKQPCRGGNRSNQYFEGLSGTAWGQAKRGASIRGIEFSITQEYAWNLFVKQHGRCAITGEQLILKEPYRKDHNASLDRIDSKLGYLYGNVWWVTIEVNLMKRNISTKRFIEICKLVAKGFRTINLNTAFLQKDLNFN